MTRRIGSIQKLNGVPKAFATGFAATSLINLFETYFEVSSVSMSQVSETIGCTPESLEAIIENRLLTLAFENWIALSNLLNIPPEEILNALEDATLEFEQHQRWLAGETNVGFGFGQACQLSN